MFFLAGFAKGNTWRRGILEQAALGPDLQRCTGIASAGVRGVGGLGGHSGRQDRRVGPKGLSTTGGRCGVRNSQGRFVCDNYCAARCSSDSFCVSFPVQTVPAGQHNEEP